jgi:protein-S-isoprenylcysteine O-methyltransferase Ste14
MQVSGRARLALSRRDLVESLIFGIFFIGQVVLCFLFYDSAGLNVLLYLGWAILVLASFMGWAARVAFQRRGGALEGESWIQTRFLVDSGIYGVVRHPMYLCFVLYIISLVFISQHWLSAIFGAPMIASLYLDMLEEEQSCIHKFGDGYKRYMQRVPRLNLFVGVIRALHRRNHG